MRKIERERIRYILVVSFCCTNRERTFPPGGIPDIMTRNFRKRKLSQEKVA